MTHAPITPVDVRHGARPRAPRLSLETGRASYSGKTADGLVPVCPCCGKGSWRKTATTRVCNRGRVTVIAFDAPERRTADGWLVLWSVVVRP